MPIEIATVDVDASTIYPHIGWLFGLWLSLFLDQSYHNNNYNYFYLLFQLDNPRSFFVCSFSCTFRLYKMIKCLLKVKKKTVLSLFPQLSSLYLSFPFFFLNFFQGKNGFLLFFVLEDGGNAICSAGFVAYCGKKYDKLKHSQQRLFNSSKRGP